MVDVSSLSIPINRRGLLIDPVTLDRQAADLAGWQAKEIKNNGEDKTINYNWLNDENVSRFMYRTEDIEHHSHGKLESISHMRNNKRL